ncbi:hypothetical protein MA16_Dca025113 [Dendrobium catenatum]|uniref:Uncharacterized protein n=1 Tax=Dendrobium catenatum TaxID=906689 RepID=A0A2I0WKY3_9ASPA|nr:hypothetical protein MA16_Dca025113 [Dendrobium catenatum]
MRAFLPSQMKGLTCMPLVCSLARQTFMKWDIVWMIFVSLDICIASAREQMHCSMFTKIYDICC